MTPDERVLVRLIRDRKVEDSCPTHGYQHCGICAERERALLIAFLEDELDG